MNLLSLFQFGYDQRHFTYIGVTMSNKVFKKGKAHVSASADAWIHL
jgi:hypothetical protein